MPAHAHSLPDRDPCDWEPLFTEDCLALRGLHCPACEEMEPQHGHLNKVAWWAGKFAEEMFAPGSGEARAAREWGYLAGLWHDLGKFAPRWQTYLRKKATSDLHDDETTGRIDHSSAGAIFAKDLEFGKLLSYLIAGHHAGLADGAYLFHERLRRPVEEWESEARAAGVPLDRPLPMPPLNRPDAAADGLAFLGRFLFSCLVDADFLATEAFMQPDKFGERKRWPEDLIPRMVEGLEAHLASKFAGVDGTPVNRAREAIRLACHSAAETRPGFFSLTVPTGGGKTLSSLLFALRHAHRHGLRRVIYVIPFTSIIRQNADVFREAFAALSRELGREIVLEHHSKFDPETETTANRLATENWDSPLVVTTNVRFFESLFANRTSACRKLHRIANSVVIFDEVQALPVGVLAPILRGLRCLVHDLRCTAVLCTATQPALDRRDDFSIGIPPEEITPIIRDEPDLFRILERVKSAKLGSVSDGELLTHIAQNASSGCLIIVNTTAAAQILHAKLCETARETFHLSARMCPAHVVSVLDQVKQLRLNGDPVYLVATQIVEAGVDISFPVVYRAECGLDSFAQAAGRCNRHGELPGGGRVYLFQPSEHPIPKMLVDLAACAGVTRAHIESKFLDGDLLSLSAIRAYFEQAIWQAGHRTSDWDQHHIVSGADPCFSQGSSSFTGYCYKTAAERFQLIDSTTHPVLIPWEKEGKALACEIRDRSRRGVPLSGSHYRRAQQLSVQVYDHEWNQSQDRLSHHCDGAFSILEHAENHYDLATGLKRTGGMDDPRAFIP